MTREELIEELAFYGDIEPPRGFEWEKDWCSQFGKSWEVCHDCELAAIDSGKEIPICLEDSFRMIFKEILRKLRKSKKISQVKLSADINLDLRTYRRYECGEGFPSFEVLCKLADYFNVSLDYLVGRSDEQ
ncbi:hypothetical protein FACS189499_07620 [Clostridia bacterium]|nr:hypothetical protein FACS189499_07620 [Clostridia bacterium]